MNQDITWRFDVDDLITFTDQYQKHARELRDPDNVSIKKVLKQLTSHDGCAYYEVKEFTYSKTPPKQLSVETKLVLQENLEKLHETKAPVEAYEMAFESEFVEPIRDGEKTVTIRFGEEWRHLSDSDFLFLTTADGRQIQYGMIDCIEFVTASTAFQHAQVVPGHKSYASRDVFLDVMNSYYEAEITPETTVSVIHFTALS